MNNLLNQKYLEQKFADDFSSPLFPVLAYLYFKKDDLLRAKKVCEIGLQHAPENYTGKFILAKILISEKRFQQAEKILKSVIKNDPINISSLRLLIYISNQINRSNNTIIKYVKTLLSLIPNDAEASKWLEQKGNHNVDFIPKRGQSETRTKEILFTSDQKYSIQNNMITFTMVNILIKQKQYNQANEVLDALKLNGSDSNKIIDIKNKITKLILSEEK